MNLPSRYPYNPPWSLAGKSAVLGTIPLIVGLLAHICGLIVLGMLIDAFSCLMIVRRVFFRRLLELKQDSLLVPGGFARARVQTIPYADIDSTWETTRQRDLTFTAVAKGRTIEIVSRFCPNLETYKEIRDFLQSVVEAQVKARPKREHQPGEGFQYCFHLNFDYTGTIYNSDGEVLWNVTTEYKRLFHIPDFVIRDRGGNEVFRITEEKRWLMARFLMKDGDRKICVIRDRSLLFTKYKFDFASGQKWTFYARLFTVFFRAVSETGAQVRIRLRQHTIWYALVDETADSPQLVAALAFMHRERLRHG